ncbi:MAG: Na(+)/H(+) antiporter subunit B [Candidatus Scalindua sediminis]|jgi:multicomponent Na+:H+ antiporter subunit B|nr:Na(+)/H(+) antiporter subunit B [Candidatus Scalindua sediminis]
MQEFIKEQIIVRTVSKFFTPFIQLYAFYVIAHGDLGPGGGFQGGVILGASMILYVIAFGMDEGRKRVSQKISDIFVSTGVLIYAGIGLLCILAGGAYLEYAELPLGSHHLASHLGIYGIEIGVGITVAFVMITIFFETAKKERKK